MRRKVFAVAVLSAALAMALSPNGALAGKRASLTVSTRLVSCTDPGSGQPAKCWGALSGSGLFPGADVFLYGDGNLLTTSWFVADDGTTSLDARFVCGVDTFTTMYATSIDTLGNPVTSKTVRPRC